jgi:hypothetical protein
MDKVFVWSAVCVDKTMMRKCLRGLLYVWMKP